MMVVKWKNKFLISLILIISVIECKKRYPIVMLSGYMGNELKVNLNNANTPKGCLKNSYINYPVWLDIISAVSFPECWKYKLRLFYNSKLKKSYSNKGIKIFTNPFGDLKGLDYISPFPQQNRINLYFGLLIQSLELNAGYKRNKDIFGAPYDWRKSPNEQADFFVNLKKLIERAYYLNNETPVILLGHSMGGSFSYLFLRKQSPKWKNKFIKTVFFMATPWGGNFKYLYTYLDNDDFAGNILPMFREIERSFPATAFLLPNYRIFGDDVLIQTPYNNYTAKNLDELFIKINRPDIIPMWLDTKNILDPLIHPGTDVICIGGKSFNTIRKMIYTKDVIIDNKYRVKLRKRSIEDLDDNLLGTKKIPNSSRNSNRGFSTFFQNNVFRNFMDRVFNKMSDLNVFSKLLPNYYQKDDNLIYSKRVNYISHILKNVLGTQVQEKSFDDKKGRYIFYSDGDGFVNIESLLGCTKFSNNTNFNFNFDLIDDSHLGMLRNQKTVDYFTKVILAIK